MQCPANMKKEKQTHIKITTNESGKTRKIPEMLIYRVHYGQTLS